MAKVNAGSPNTLTDALSWALTALEADSVAVLFNVAGAPGAVTTTETEPEAAAARSFKSHVTLPLAKLPPPLALTKLVPAGIGSTSWALVAVPLPELLYCSV